ncbi:pentatricopeptide repeat-containing protein 2, mitochondrial isoform X2 [Fukomys damarensis]|uniref:pentatricopeptide repeat-containing protein 2, mitochondrial isoform X2 n=1 Tax=Fukomys damarensis TaxID=885580 RepID=UPI00145567BA|nr:pentatricopeptide repeat-containing protein 2, mitochondrial isoform X2 [Fukomys damarensis]
MAATFQSLAKAGLPAPRIFLLPWVAGSCPTCCRCPLGETYFRNLEEKLTQKKLILKDELTTLLHLCQSQEDVELAKSVIHRYHAENRNMTLGEYKFGPVFMRLCYEMDLEESAVELIKDQHLRGFFSDSTSFSILMDMLFIKGNYEGALEVLIEMKNQDVKFTQDTYVLAFAICYKLNSPESFKICTTLREDALVKGDIISKRASCFAVALALNQNEVAKAVSIFSQIMNPVSIACTNLNIMIHIQSNMLETLIEILQGAAEGNLSKFVIRHKFSNEVLAKVKEKVKDVPALVARYEEIYGKLHIHGQVTSYTLDALLCYTPRNKNSHTSLLNRRKFSQRTFQPLNKSLLVE